MDVCVVPRERTEHVSLCHIQQKRDAEPRLAGVYIGAVMVDDCGSAARSSETPAERPQARGCANCPRKWVLLMLNVPFGK